MGLGLLYFAFAAVLCRTEREVVMIAFSGVPIPTWVITDAQEAELARLLETSSCAANVTYGHSTASPTSLSLRRSSTEGDTYNIGATRPSFCSSC